MRIKPQIIDLTDELVGKEKWILGDIHGRWHLLEAFLDQIEFDPEKHAILSVGDLVDRGQEPEKVIRFMQEYGKPVIGNHEYMWLELYERYGLPYDENGCIRQPYRSFQGDDGYDRRNGMWATVRALAERGPAAEWVINYFSSLPSAIIIDNVLIVHAGVDPSKAEFSELTEEDLVWIREGYADYDGPIPEALRMGRTLVTGHTITYQMGGEPGEVILRPNRIFLDIGAAADIGLAAYNVNDKTFLYVEGPNLPILKQAS